MSIQSEKFRSFNTERKASLKTVSSAVSALDGGLMVALKQQAYIHTNPDDNGVNELIPIMSDEIDKIGQALTEANSKAADLLAVKSGSMTVTQLLAKYPAINLEEYSDELL
jgi:hypothetical protein